MAEVELIIADRSYRLACRDGEEANLKAAGAMVDAKSREALAGLGTLSESRQLLFASLLLADQLVDGRTDQIDTGPDPALVERANRLADALEQIADTLEERPATS